jgi:isochorismate hydrolase
LTAFAEPLVAYADAGPAEGDQMPEVPIHPGRVALVIVDMQNCFVAGSPVAAPLGEQVAERLKQLAATTRPPRDTCTPAPH